MKYYKFAIVFLAFLLIITLYDINNFLSIGIVSLFLIINISVFLFISNNVIVGCRNIFGLLSVESLAYWCILREMKKIEFIADHSKIDFQGISSSLIFSIGVSVFFFLLFLIIQLSAKEE